MTKAELESKHLSDLHALAAEAGVERFRMLTRNELIAKLSDGKGGGNGRGGERQQRPSAGARERPPRRRRRRSGSGDPLGDEAVGPAPRDPVSEKPTPMETPEPPPAPRAAAAPSAESSEPARPKRRRRRRRFGRRKEGVTIQDLLLPPESGRQAILCAETREGCTTLLRSVAADLAADSKGPDPIVLLIDPSPEELADWKREAPQAELVAAGQARHASDALAQASSRAGSEDVILLVDSLTRLASEDFGDTDAAKEFFDAGRAQGSSGGGSLTVVVAIERPA